MFSDSTAVEAFKSGLPKVTSTLSYADVTQLSQKRHTITSHALPRTIKTLTI
jgi:hypothetical protein